MKVSRRVVVGEEAERAVAVARREAEPPRGGMLLFC